MGGFGGGVGGQGKSMCSFDSGGVCNLIKTLLLTEHLFECKKLVFSNVACKLLHSLSRNLIGIGGGIKSSSLIFESVVPAEF